MWPHTETQGWVMSQGRFFLCPLCSTLQHGSPPPHIQNRHMVEFAPHLHNCIQPSYCVWTVIPSYLRTATFSRGVCKQRGLARGTWRKWEFGATQRLFCLGEVTIGVVSPILLFWGYHKLPYSNFLRSKDLKELHFNWWLSRHLKVPHFKWN